VGLLLRGFPTPVIIFLTTLGGAIYTCLRLARHGLELADIATLLAVILLTAAFVLPAMERTRSRTLGRRLFPSVVPARYMTLLSGSE
jgi:hypothetical protein